jgi:hypothetical protein
MNNINAVMKDIPNNGSKSPYSVISVKSFEGGDEKGRPIPDKLFMKNSSLPGGTDMGNNTKGSGASGKLGYIPLASPGTEIVDEIKNGNHEV